MSETIAVFIDGDNISPKDIEAILTEIHDSGRIIIQRVYLDWTRATCQGWIKASQEFGLEPIQCDLIHGKNSSDIKLTVDVMKTLYTVEHISLFYLVTSDGDFRHIIPEIKIRNRQVNVIGGSISRALCASCDKYTKIDVLQANLPTGQTDNLTKLVVKYREEIDKLLDQKGTIALSLVKDTLQRKYGFDHREYGFQQFTKFMEHYYPIYQVINSRTGSFLMMKK